MYILLSILNEVIVRMDFSIKELTKKDISILNILINKKNMSVSEAIRLLLIEVYFLSYKDRFEMRKRSIDEYSIRECKRAVYMDMLSKR